MQINGRNFLVKRFPFNSVTPVTAVDPNVLKNHIQVSHNLDDDIIKSIGGYLQAATEQAEDRGSVALIRQQRIQTVDDSAIGYLSGTSVGITRGPILSVTAVKYIDVAGATQTLNASFYRVLTHSNRVYFKSGLPVMDSSPDACWIEYDAGYGDDCDSIPAAWQNIIMTIAMRLYDYRGGDSGSTNDSWERMIHRMVRNAGDSAHHA